MFIRKLAHLAHKRHVATQPEKKRRSIKQNVFQSLLNQDTCFEVIQHFCSIWKSLYL